MAATQTPTLIVKLTLGTDIRRFTASSAEGTLTWSAIAKRVADCFGVPKHDFKLTYVDDENDRITVSTDEELGEAVALALASTPPVLRLTVQRPQAMVSTGSEAGVKMCDAATMRDVSMTRDAATMSAAAAIMRDRGMNCESTTTRDAATMRDSAMMCDAGNNTTTSNNPTVDNELSAFVETLAMQLPAVLHQLPEAVRNLIPHAELDVAATVAASKAAAEAAAAAACQGANDHPMPHMADPYCPGNPHAPGAKEGVHEGVTCDKSGMRPIVGDRYHLVGHNYDLCEAEYIKLTDKEKALFRRIAPPAAAAPQTHEVHHGVECDRSGQCPIVGPRYHLRGHDYDLCQSEFDKMPATEKLLYEVLPPRNRGGAYHNQCQAQAWANAHAGPFAAAFAGANGNGTNTTSSTFSAPFGPWRPGPGSWGCRANGWGNPNNGAGRGVGGGRGGPGGEGKPNLAARFVRDVTIFDGTQMAPATKFTKIWRLKNVGDVPWPPGTRMLFVGGDQMTTEMSVPLSRESVVMPGEEVDVAVEMAAPAELGRYLGYWRLVGPHGRRKFGQRVWCHVQVVDPSQEVSAAEADPESIRKALAEIEAKKCDLARTEGDDGAEEADKEEEKEAEEKEAEDGDKAAAAAAAAAAASTASGVLADAATMIHAVGISALVEGAVAEMAGTAVEGGKPAAAAEEEKAPAAETKEDDEMATAEAAQAAVAAEGAADGNASDATDDCVLVTDGMLIDAIVDAKATGAAGPSGVAPPSPPSGVKGELMAMGFADPTMLDAVVSKHGEDLEACARDLAAASEWDSLLDDLSEMGFADRELNKTLMLKHAGNLKRTVRDLVEA